MKCCDNHRNGWCEVIIIEEGEVWWESYQRVKCCENHRKRWCSENRRKEYNYYVGSFALRINCWNMKPYMVFLFDLMCCRYSISGCTLRSIFEWLNMMGDFWWLHVAVDQWWLVHAWCGRSMHACMWRPIKKSCFNNLFRLPDKTCVHKWLSKS